MKTIFKLETSSPADSHEAVLVPPQAPNSLVPDANPEARPGAGDLPNQQATVGDPHLPRLAYSVKETAAILGVSEKTIRRLIDRRLLKVSRGLRHLRIPKSELTRYLDDTLV